MSRLSTGTPAKPFRVGAIVIVRLGSTRLRARIIEDRGPIGVGGRRLFRVQPLSGSDDAGQSFEVPADQLTHAK